MSNPTVVPAIVETRANLVAALKAGQPLTDDAARALVRDLGDQERRAGWNAGYSQAKLDATESTEDQSLPRKY